MAVGSDRKVWKVVTFSLARTAFSLSRDLCAEKISDQHHPVMMRSGTWGPSSSRRLPQSSCWPPEAGPSAFLQNTPILSPSPWKYSYVAFVVINIIFYYYKLNNLPIKIMIFVHNFFSLFQVLALICSLVKLWTTIWELKKIYLSRKHENIWGALVSVSARAVLRASPGNKEAITPRILLFLR